MATKKMLIDATHSEETRVVVLDGTRLDEFDVEAAHRKQLKGNIYLAKVTRVEPSLQAAFVEYGGNRHGFLAFNEIHPDYYQIPVADREALKAEQEEADRAASEQRSGDANGNGEEDVEEIGGDDMDDGSSRRAASLPQRRYKIQEVIKRRQILLVQVVKEERGNKGAALTTFISLAGRYCVLMPNTPRGGGISRKIGSAGDRKRLKKIIADLEVPEGMAIIVRTAGAERTKTEIKRDADYLLRLWDEIRETTLKSTAPTLVHEEGNLIKRTIRDLYGNDIEEIIVDGDEGYRTAKEFMKLLIPSHAKKVQPYKDSGMPLFHRYQVESQLDAMHSSTVQLKSGGYIVINPTEALVAIDVNSGRATKERNIEETALKTNVEAAVEIARQLRLRDLAGLIVIDFIDMEVSRNQAQVERRLKEALKSDRARIQVGRISPFGLLEMSRQRLRPGLHETAYEVCPFCGGAGTRRSVESSALHVLRAIEDEGIRRRSAAVTVHVPTDIALYMLNQKRTALAEIEGRYDFSVFVVRDEDLIPPDYRIERTRPRAEGATDVAVPPPVAALPALDESASEEALSGEEEVQAVPAAEGEKRSKRRRRPRRRRPDDEAGSQPSTAAEPRQQAVEDGGGEEDGPDGPEKTAVVAAGDEEGTEKRSKRKRRGRRGGRRRSREHREDGDTAAIEVGAEPPAMLGSPVLPELLASPESPELIEPPAKEKEEKKRRERQSRDRKSRREGKRDIEAPGETPEVIYARSPDPEVIYAPAPEPEVIYAPAPADEAKPPARKRAASAAKPKKEAGEKAVKEAKPARTRKPKTEKAAEDSGENTQEKPVKKAAAKKAPAKKAPAKKADKKAADEKAATDKQAPAVTVVDVDALKSEEAPKRSGWWKR